MAQVMSAEDLSRAIRRIAHEILERHRGADHVVLVGIHSRGVPLAEEIADAIDLFERVKVPVGELDIGLYRDDLGLRPTTRLSRTLIPVDLTSETVILVDDVLFTGRTIRSALDALADLGRPEKVELAVMVDRGHRELPIRADYVGKNIPTASEERVAVRLQSVDGTSGVWIGSEDES
ncbi:MAG: bifunctional pyr operon transcriptional regulator/uracil phosphoribosyltransferase PyrR [Acidimicrobiia bacterium]|nr:bifunctional pyr operon transcriptional regulator/uracil phosphoribosyltransferase PyrR [Acidimicrobiia bacterium]MDH4306863.1 bifunctional pyr operon transcriptional regulator/uracil phosphoribosyltransferase PyrR [Acidimicrobiia bacterium]